VLNELLSREFLLSKKFVTTHPVLGKMSHSKDTTVFFDSCYSMTYCNRKGKRGFRVTLHKTCLGPRKFAMSMCRLFVMNALFLKKKGLNTQVP